MVRDLTCKRMLITGASRGLGRALVEQAAMQGACVAAAARSGDKLEELAALLKSRGVEILPVTADVTSDNDRHRLIDAVLDRFGGLDVLVNNAGVASWGHFATSNEDVLRQIMEVNFFAPAELIRLAAPYLMQGKQPAVVNIASLCGRRGLPAWSEHSASKHALVGLTEALRGELARFDIDVLLILPGLIRSDDLGRHLLRREGKMDMGFDKAMPPDTAATQILRAIQNNRTETVLGWQANWIVRVNRLWPWFVDVMMARQVRKLYAS